MRFLRVSREAKILKNVKEENYRDTLYKYQGCVVVTCGRVHFYNKIIYIF